MISLQLAIPFDLLPDDLQAVLPELARADVDAEAGGQVGGSPFARGGQQGFVIGHEVRAALEVNGIQPGGEEQAEGVGEVVERASG